MPRAPEDFCAPTFTPSTKCEDFLRHHSQQLVKAAVPNGGAKLPHRRSLSLSLSLKGHGERATAAAVCICSCDRYVGAACRRW